MVTTYVDASTGDQLKSEGVVLSTGGIGIPVVTRYEDYREIHGIRIPFQSISSNEEAGQTITQYEAIEVNLDVGDGIFTLSPPAED